MPEPDHPVVVPVLEATSMTVGVAMLRTVAGTAYGVVSLDGTGPVSRVARAVVDDAVEEAVGAAS